MAHKDVQRQNTINEIKKYALEQMGNVGTSGISMSAIARKMEISSPALYRYFDSRDHLIRALIDDACNDLISSLENTDNSLPAANYAGRFLEVANKFREWSLAHPMEFLLIFNLSLSHDPAARTIAQQGSQRVLTIITDVLRGANQAGILKPIAEIAESLDNADAKKGALVENLDHPMSSQIHYASTAAWSRMLGLIMLELMQRPSVDEGSTTSIFQKEVTAFMKTVGLEIATQENQTKREQKSPLLKTRKSSSDVLHVVFGSGPLGLAVMNELVKRGKQVRMVNRTGNAALPEEVELMVGDAFQMEFTRKACQNAAVVYQCAQPANSNWLERFSALNAAILDGAAAKGAKFIYGDNMLVYGAVEGLIHEGLAYKPQSRRGQIRARVAEMILTAHRSGRVRGAIARASDFFGPHVTTSLFGVQFLNQISQGKTVTVYGNPNVPHIFTYIEDFGKALVLLGEREDALGQIWHVPNPPALPQSQFIDLFCDEVGSTSEIHVTSKRLLSLKALFLAEAREKAEILYQLEKPLLVDSSKFEKFFRIAATPLPEAARRTIAWYKRNEIV